MLSIPQFRSSSDFTLNSNQLPEKSAKPNQKLGARRSSMDVFRRREAGRAAASPNLSRRSGNLMELKHLYTKSINNVWSALCEVYYSAQNKQVFSYEPEEFEELENFGLNIDALLFSELRPSQQAIEDMLNSAETNNWPGRYQQALKAHLKTIQANEKTGLLNSARLSDKALQALGEIQNALHSKSWAAAINLHSKLNDAIDQLSGAYHLLTSELGTRISGRESNFRPSDKPNILPRFVWEQAAPEALSRSFFHQNPGN